MHITTIINIILPLALLPTISAKCCSGGTCISWATAGKYKTCSAKGCPDGTKIPSGFGCCGYRACNIFCCNCDATGDGKICREKSSRLVRDVSESFEESISDADMFSEANTGGDGKMTFEEFAAYSAVPEEERASLEQKFHIFDLNGDGFLTVDEMRLPEGAQIV